MGNLHWLEENLISHGLILKRKVKIINLSVLKVAQKLKIDKIVKKNQKTMKIKNLSKLSIVKITNLCKRENLMD